MYREVSVNINRFIKNRATRAVKRWYFAAQIPKALHISLNFAFSGANIRTFRTDNSAATANILPLFVNRDVFSGHSCVINKKGCSSQTGNSTSYNVGVFVFDTIRLFRVIKEIIKLHILPPNDQQQFNLIQLLTFDFVCSIILSINLFNR